MDATYAAGIKLLLSWLLPEEDMKYKWLNSHNTNFGMHPQEMIDSGREEEVFAYLHYAVYGPY